MRDDLGVGLLLALLLSYLAVQGLVRRWIARQLAEERISKRVTVGLLVLTAGTGIGLTIGGGMLIVTPGLASLPGMLAIVLAFAVAWVLVMAAANYAAIQADQMRKDREHQQAARVDR